MASQCIRKRIKTQLLDQSCPYFFQKNIKGEDCILAITFSNSTFEVIIPREYLRTGFEYSFTGWLLKGNDQRGRSLRMKIDTSTDTILLSPRDLYMEQGAQ